MLPGPGEQPPAPQQARVAGQSGFTLLEMLVAMFLLMVGLLGVAPMFAHAVRVTATSADLGTLGASAVQKLEVLRKTSFASLTAGGSLTANSTGYFDTSNPKVTLRWTIANNATPPTKKTITIRAVATRANSVGSRKTVQLVTLRAK